MSARPMAARAVNHDPGGAVCPFCPTRTLGRQYVFPHIKGPKQMWKAETAGGVYVSFEPLNPVAVGHLLVAPVEHVESAADSPDAAAGAMEVAASIVRDRRMQANIITSIGTAATQTVTHLHVHIVPRAEGDGLSLPWTGQ